MHCHWFQIPNLTPMLRSEICLIFKKKYVASLSFVDIFQIFKKSEIFCHGFIKILGRKLVMNYSRFVGIVTLDVCKLAHYVKFTNQLVYNVFFKENLIYRSSFKNLSIDIHKTRYLTIIWNLFRFSMCEHNFINALYFHKKWKAICVNHFCIAIETKIIKIEDTFVLEEKINRQKKIYPYDAYLFVLTIEYILCVILSDINRSRFLSYLNGYAISVYHINLILLGLSICLYIYFNFFWCSYHVCSVQSMLHATENVN